MDEVIRPALFSFYDKISQVQSRIKTQVQVFYILKILGFFSG